MGMTLLQLTLGWAARRRVPPLPNGRLLDVGCGNGEWMAWIRNNLPGWEVEGSEVNVHAAAQAQAQPGSMVHLGQLEELGLPDSHYDMVSFWHSLEHLPSPATAVREAHRVLRPGGWLGIEVPNIDSWEARAFGSDWYHLAVPFHLYHFSPRTLARLLTQAGFSITSCEYVRGQTSLVHGLIRRSTDLPAGFRLLAQSAARTIGRLSPWGFRVYAIRAAKTNP
jgi:ubiquinone/menaquinone biosynthesis C-methylase UbiE